MKGRTLTASVSTTRRNIAPNSSASHHHLIEKRVCMKTKAAVSTKQPSVALPDLQTKKNPTGWVRVAVGDVNRDGMPDKHNYIGTVTLVK